MKYEVYTRTDTEAIEKIVSWILRIAETLHFPSWVCLFLTKLWWHFHICAYCCPKEYLWYYEQID